MDSPNLHTIQIDTETFLRLEKLAYALGRTIPTVVRSITDYPYRLFAQARILPTTEDLHPHATNQSHPKP